MCRCSVTAIDHLPLYMPMRTQSQISPSQNPHQDRKITRRTNPVNKKTPYSKISLIYRPNRLFTKGLKTKKFPVLLLAFTPYYCRHLGWFATGVQNEVPPAVMAVSFLLRQWQKSQFSGQKRIFQKKKTKNEIILDKYPFACKLDNRYAFLDVIPRCYCSQTGWLTWGKGEDLLSKKSSTYFRGRGECYFTILLLALIFSKMAWSLQIPGCSNLPYGLLELRKTRFRRFDVSLAGLAGKTRLHINKLTVLLTLS